LYISDCIWIAKFVDKIISKHNVYPYEVEELFAKKPITRKHQKGDVKGEDLYIAFGQTDSGRKLAVLFIRKKGKYALVISARDMTKREKRSYGKRR